MALQKKTKILGVPHWQDLVKRTFRSNQTGAFHLRATRKSMKRNTFRVVTIGTTVKTSPTLTVRCQRKRRRRDDGPAGVKPICVGGDRLSMVGAMSSPEASTVGAFGHAVSPLEALSL